MFERAFPIHAPRIAAAEQAAPRRPAAKGAILSGLARRLTRALRVLEMLVVAGGGLS